MRDMRGQRHQKGQRDWVERVEGLERQRVSQEFVTRGTLSWC